MTLLQKIGTKNAKIGVIVLLGTTGKGILKAYASFKTGKRKKGRVPELWTVRQEKG